MWLRLQRALRELSGANSGLAAVEFAMVVPLMLVLFFGTVEFSSALAIDRKVTVMATQMMHGLMRRTLPGFRFPR